MSYVGKYNHGLADDRLDPAFQRCSCPNKDKDEAHLGEKERGWKWPCIAVVECLLSWPDDLLSF